MEGVVAVCGACNSRFAEAYQGAPHSTHSSSVKNPFFKYAMPHADALFGQVLTAILSLQNGLDGRWIFCA